MSKTLLDLLEDYSIEIKKEGSLSRSFCPFHDDAKKPNFTIYPDTGDGGSWFCFCCSVGGNTAAFLAKMENISYKDALAKLKGDETKLEDLKQRLDGCKVQDDPLDYSLDTNLYLSQCCREKLKAHPEKELAIVELMKSFDEESINKYVSYQKMKEWMKSVNSL